MTTDGFPPTRYIHTKATARQISDLLQNLFVAELVSPSSRLWLVSPWISDIPVIDNRTNGFLAFEQSWIRSQITLSQVLAKLHELGTTIHIATRPDEHNNAFLDRMTRLISHDASCFFIHSAEELHEKGILTDSAYLSGSMNFTFNGISLNEEAVTFSIDPALIAESRVILSARWREANP